MAKQILKVGFDLDGVILYNPARIIRPFISYFKKIFLFKRKLSFYYPRTSLEKFIWYFFHKSSIFVAPGLKKVIKLIRKDQLQAYIITARFDYLKKDFQHWISTSRAEKYFRGCFHNNLDEQPHLFKEKMIDKLHLDIYVEDNWDIVQYLSKKFPNKKIFWIYNIFDRNNNYPYKFPSLQKAIDQIEKDL